MDGITITYELILEDGKYHWYFSDGGEFQKEVDLGEFDTVEEAYAALDVTYPIGIYGRHYL
jgi:hypothetical protein